MLMPRRITSAQNSFVKQLIDLRHARERRKQNLVLIDDDRNISRALEAGWTIHAIAIQEDPRQPSNPHVNGINHLLSHRAPTNEIDFVCMPEELFTKIAYGQSSHSVALATPRMTSIDEIEAISQRTQASFMVLDCVEKPGNIGAAIRTCDALGIDALLLCDPICDLWNPNAMRASAGAIFSLPILIGDETSLREHLQRYDFKLFAARLEDSTDYLDTKFPDRTAIVFGNEAQGLADRWHGVANPISISMRGLGDSLNVSVSAAIIFSELVRQRRESSRLKEI